MTKEDADERTEDVDPSARVRQSNLVRDDLFRLERTWLGLCGEARLLLEDAASVVGVDLPPLHEIARIARLIADQVPSAGRPGEEIDWQ